MQRRPWHPWLLSRLSRVLVAVAVARAVTTAASSLDPASGTVRLGPLPGPCPPGSFSNCDKRCLRDEFVCDGKVDCALKQDETAPACPQTCKPGAFFCDGRCWADYRRCDGFKDCKDGQDEKGCVLSGLEFFVCQTRTMGFRITPERHSPMIRCDGYKDCPKRDDEQGCHDEECRKNTTFFCDNICYPVARLCDHFIDCPDGSDESNCELTMTTTTTTTTATPSTTTTATVAASTTSTTTAAATAVAPGAALHGAEATVTSPREAEHVFAIHPVHPAEPLQPAEPATAAGRVSAGVMLSPSTRAAEAAGTHDTLQHDATSSSGGLVAAVVLGVVAAASLGAVTIFMARRRRRSRESAHYNVGQGEANVTILSADLEESEQHAGDALQDLRGSGSHPGCGTLARVELLPDNGQHSSGFI